MFDGSGVPPEIQSFVKLKVTNVKLEIRLGFKRSDKLFCL